MTNNVRPKQAGSKSGIIFLVSTLLLLGTALETSFYITFERIRIYSLVNYTTKLNSPQPWKELLLWLVPFLLLWSVVYYLFLAETKKHQQYFSGNDLLRIFWPILLLFLLGFLPPDIYSPILSIVILGWAALRGAAAWPSPQTVLPSQQSDRRIPYLLITLTLAMAIIGFTYQQKALNSLYLLCCDWTDYLDAANNTLRGKWFMSSVSNESFLGAHFSPASILLLCPYVWLFHSTEAFFALNSLILYSNVILLYWLSRTLMIPRLMSGIMAMFLLLSPSLINMNVALFYGFHDIYMVMPMILLFFICQEKKWWAASFVCFGLSLLVKETVPVFWAGLGLVFIVWGRRKTGITLIIVSCVYWLLAMKVFIPAFSPRPIYDYASRFSHLGNSIWEIALSPLLRPKIFFVYLFRPGCIYFVTMLLLPVVFMVINRPLLLLGAGVTLGFICVQNTDQLQNIHMQYQAETVILIFICAVYNLRAILDGKPGWIFNWFCRWSGFKFKAANGARAVLIATAFTAAGSFFFFGENPWGPNSCKKFTDRPDRSAVIAELMSLIPVGVPIQTTLNLGCKFMLRNPVHTDLEDIRDDYVLLDLYTHFNDIRQVDRLRKKMLTSGYRVIFTKADEQINIILFSKSSKAAQADDAISNIDDTSWEEFGKPLIDPNHQELHVRAALFSQPTPIVIIRCRLTSKVNRDYELLCSPAGNETVFVRRFTFGNGVTPAFLAQPGQVYTMSIPLSEPAQLEDLTIKVVPRPDID